MSENKNLPSDIKYNLPPPSEVDVREALELLLRVPNVLDRLIEVKDKDRKRRSNWSKLSNNPYYSERFARELQVVIDDMITNGVNKEYRYEDYKNISHRTLYARVAQARMYLLDNMDPDMHYAKLFRKISVSSEVTGVRLSHTHEPANVGPAARTLSMDDEKSIWKNKVDEFVATSVAGDKLHLKNLSLTPEEIATQRESFVELEEKGILIAFVAGTEIKIVRLQ